MRKLKLKEVCELQNVIQLKEKEREFESKQSDQILWS